MGLFGWILTLCIVAIIASTVYTLNSNYLDSHINKNLDIKRDLYGEEGAKTEEERIMNNDKILDTLSIISKLQLINHYKNIAKMSTSVIENPQGNVILPTERNTAPPELTGNVDNKFK